MFSMHERRIVFGFTAIVILSAISGCGRDYPVYKPAKAPDAPSVQAEPSSNESTLQGAWTTEPECQSRMKSVTFFYGKRVSQSVEIFSDDECKDLVRAVQFNALYSLDPPAKDGQDWTMRITRGSAYETLFDGDEIAKRRSESYCGVSDWERGKSVDLTGRDCGPPAELSEQVHFDHSNFVWGPTPAPSEDGASGDGASSDAPAAAPSPSAKRLKVWSANGLSFTRRGAF